MNFFNRTTYQGNLLLLFLWVVLLLTLFLIKSVLLPFIFAGLLAYILNPIVSRLTKIEIRKKKIPVGIVVFAVYIVVAVIVYIFATWFLPELYLEFLKMVRVAKELLQQLTQSKIQEFALAIDSFFSRNNLPIKVVAPFAKSTLVAPPQLDNVVSIDLAQMLQNIIHETGEYIQAQTMDIVDRLQLIIRQIANFVFKFFLVLMLAVFMLVDLDRVKRFAFALSPTKNKKNFDAFIRRLDLGLSGAIRGQLVICVVNAVLTFIGLWLLQVKFALVLATIAGIFSLIPIFGSILSTIPIAIIALLKSPFTALLAVLWIVVIHIIEANVLNPKILGRSTRIHPVLIILALLTGEHLFGLVGALLAVPIASVLLNIFQALLYKSQQIREEKI